MRKILPLIVIIILFNAVGCKNLNYILLETSSKNVPNWVFDHDLITKNNDDEYLYVVGESDEQDKTLCEKNASLYAIDIIIENIYKNINNNLKNENKNDIKEKIMLNINGIETVDSYIELKKYKKSLGAKANERLYSCYKVIKIKKSSMKKIIEKLNQQD